MPEIHSNPFTVNPDLLQYLDRKSRAVVSSLDNDLVSKMISSKINKVGLVLDPLTIGESIQRINESSDVVTAKLSQQYDLDVFSYKRVTNGDEADQRRQELTAKLIKSHLLSGFDPGLSRSLYFYPSNEDSEMIHEDGAYIMRRSTFISEMEERQKREVNRQGRLLNPNFSFIDISNVRRADVEVTHGSKAADLLVNRAAKAIELATIQYCQEHGIDKTQYPTIGRYGGDEFVIGWIPPLTPKDKVDFEKKFKEILSPELTERDTPTTGYYGVTNPQERAKSPYRKGKIEMKHNSIDWIETPINSHERYVFEDYFARGLILTRDELQIVMKKRDFQETGSFSLDKYVAYQKEIRKPSALDGLPYEEQKVDYLAIRHKNFAIPLYLAQYWDEVETQDTGIKTTRRQSAMVEYTKNIVYDKLLGYGVVSKYDFQEQIARGDIGYTVAIDLKFIKEMNEIVGYAEADESISKLWEMIKSKMLPEDRLKCTFARAGGTFYIGLNRGEYMTEDMFNKLKSLSSFAVDLSSTGRGKVIQVPLGNSLQKVSYPATNQQNDFGETIGDCEENFFFDILNELKNDPKLLTTIENNIDPITLGNPIAFGELLWRFFRLKRYDERVIKLIDQMTKHDLKNPLRTTVVQLYGVLIGLDDEERAVGVMKKIAS